MTTLEMLKLIDVAIEATNMEDDYSTGMRNGLRYARYLIDDTKDPEFEKCESGNDKKVGHWIEWKETLANGGYTRHCKCSECGKAYDSYTVQFMYYCANCGAKMKR